MPLKLELFKTHTSKELSLHGDVNEDLLFVYNQLIKGFTKDQIIKDSAISPWTVTKSLKSIRSMIDYKGADKNAKFQQLLWINSGVLLSQHIDSQDLTENFNLTKDNFILNFTPAQLAAIKLYLNGYSKQEIKKIFGIHNDSSIASHLKVLKDGFGSEIKGRDSQWFLESGFSFESLVHLVFLYQYAKGHLDTNYRQVENNSNIIALAQDYPNVFKPIIGNEQIHRKLKHLRDI